MDDDHVVEGELVQLRQLLMHDEQLPVGIVPRLEAAVRRDRIATEGVGWEPRLGIACVCFIALGLWLRPMMSTPVAVVVALLALAYPWAALGARTAMCGRSPSGSGRAQWGAVRPMSRR